MRRRAASSCNAFAIATFSSVLWNEDVMLHSMVDVTVLYLHRVSLSILGEHCGIIVAV